MTIAVQASDPCLFSACCYADHLNSASEGTPGPRASFLYSIFRWRSNLPAVVVNQHRIPEFLTPTRRTRSPVISSLRVSLCIALFLNGLSKRCSSSLCSFFSLPFSISVSAARGVKATFRVHDSSLSSVGSEKPYKISVNVMHIQEIRCLCPNRISGNGSSSCTKNMVRPRNRPDRAVVNSNGRRPHCRFEFCRGQLHLAQPPGRCRGACTSITYPTRNRLTHTA